MYSKTDFNLEQHGIIHDMYDVTRKCPMNCVVDYFISKVIVFYQKHLSAHNWGHDNGLVYGKTQGSMLSRRRNNSDDICVLYKCNVIIFSVLNAAIYTDVTNLPNTIWERIWEKGPIGNFFTNSIPEKLPL